MIGTNFIVQKFDRNVWEWIERSPDGCDHYSSLDHAKYFCDAYIKDGEECRVIREEVVYDPDRKPK